MNKYIAKLLLDVEISAWTESDAREAIEDALGKGSLPGIEVVDEEVLDFQELT